MVEKQSAHHPESEYVAICYSSEDETRRNFVAVIQKDPNQSNTNVLQVLKHGLEVVYERPLVNSRVTSWHLTRDRFIYMTDENSRQITYLRFSRG